MVVLDGPSRGMTIGDYSISVIAPEDGYMERVGASFWHDSANPSVGFTGAMYLLPDDVSFSKIRFREGGGTAITEGSLDGMNPKEHATGPWRGIITDTTESAGGGKTNRVATLDYVTVFCPFFGPDGPGTLKWPIEWEYEQESNVGVAFTIATMNGTIDGALTATVSKAGAGPVSAPNGPPDGVPNGWPPNFPY